MKYKLSFFLILFCSLTCLAQKTDENLAGTGQLIILKKQILVDEFDRRANDIPLAAVRVFIRTTLAQWLWKDGSDDTGRAEQIAVKAVEDLYENKNEIPDSSMQMRLFPLLEINAKETAQKLRTKYNIKSDEDLSSAFSLLNKQGGDKIVAEKIRKNLPNTKDLASTALYLNILQKQGSPELLPVLFEIINLQESGRANFTTASFLWIAFNFSDPGVPDDLRTRFYKIALARARNALQFSDPGEIHFADLLLNRILPGMKANAPDIVVEASGIKSALLAKTSQRMRDLQERDKRIEESANKLDALIAEVDKTDDRNAKYDLLIRANMLAISEKKFQLAVDLIEKSIEDGPDKNSPDPGFHLSYHDQQLNQIVNGALESDNTDLAVYATKKIVNDLKRAGAILQTARYFYRKKDDVSAFNNYDEALKLTVKAENDKLKIRQFLDLLSAASYMDQGLIPKISAITAKAINEMPALNVDDKPGTENFKNYLSTIMMTNYSLYGTTLYLSMKNRNDAADFTSQINRREIKPIVDLAFAIEAIESETRLIKSK